MGVHRYELQAAGRLVFLGGNPAADRLLGVDNTAFIGRTIEEAFPLLADTEVPARYRAAAEHGTSWQTEQLAYADDQISGAFELHAFQTSPGKMAVLFQEVTERRRMEQALAQSEQRFRLLAENANDVIWTRGLDGKLTYVSPSVERMSGYTPAEMHQLTVVDTSDAESAQRIAELLAGELAKPLAERLPAVTADLVQISKDGRAYDVEISANWILDSEGNPIGVQGITRDISERKSAEAERAQLEAQLRQSQKMEAIGRLAGGVAHDFNNLLTGILGYSELIETSLNPADPICADLQEIRAAAERAAQLTSQLLAFSRKQTTAPLVVEPNAVVERSQRMLSRIIGEDVRLVFSPGDDLGHIKIDPAQLDQILVNLAVNARDAMPRGGELTIETSSSSLLDAPPLSNPAGVSERVVQIAMTDTGHGMDEETKARIFEPFFSTKSDSQGTGLGLATVYGIVKQNHGSIAVTSEPGAGATFRICFPTVTDSVASLEAPQVSQAGGTELVLLVEDDEMVLKLAKRSLERRGYQVLAAATGSDALVLADRQAGAIDLLLTDVVMPGMNGRELVAAMSKLQPTLKVLYTSGYTADVIARHGVLDEGTAFLQKPYDVASLCQKVRQVLGE